MWKDVKQRYFSASYKDTVPKKYFVSIQVFFKKNVLKITRTPRTVFNYFEIICDRTQSGRFLYQQHVCY